MPGGRRGDSVSTMALKARSPIVAMDANPLSEAQTARLLAAECYQLKFAHSRLSDEICMLKKLRDAEERVWRNLRRSKATYWTELLRPSFVACLDNNFLARCDEL